MTTLNLEGVSVRRSGSDVVRNAALCVAPGEITVLLGANGAGKTTLLEAISGVLPVAAGRITLADEPLHTLLPLQRAQRGLIHIEQGRSVFAGLTVRENLLVAGRPDELEASFALFPELHPRREVLAGLLSGGEQQMLVIARALLRRPRMLLIDELSLGLAPMVVRRLLHQVRELADSGVGVLLVEQFAALALALGDRAYVLRHGAMAYSGSCAELRDDPELLRQAYLG
jgi:branched-chain amino acid transport system ATP-binding protein